MAVGTFTKSYEVISSKGRRFTIVDTFTINGKEAVQVDRQESAKDLNQWSRRQGATPSP